MIRWWRQAPTAALCGNERNLYVLRNTATGSCVSDVGLAGFSVVFCFFKTNSILLGESYKHNVIANSSMALLFVDRDEFLCCYFEVLL